MRTSLLPVGMLALMLALAAPANAQAPSLAPATKLDPLEVRALASNYELTSADGSLKCPMTLEARTTGPGLLLTFDRKQCTPLFGFLSEVAVWRPGVAGAILFVSADERTIAEFTEGVGGVYEAIRENDAVYFLANLQFVDPSQRVQIADLFGEWSLARPGGQEICRITLTEDVAGNELFAARVDPQCDAAIGKLGLEFWRLDRGDVLLRARDGEALRFERQEDGTWNKVPEKPQPLVLSRP